MSDVRSLLRSEQASRRISHPHLSYTRTGQLNCTVCNLLIKSASLWEGHLRSPNHRKNAQRSADPALQISQAKKRKNDDSDEETRKRSRGVSEEEGPVAEIVNEAVEADRPKKKAKSVTFAEDTMVKLVESKVNDGQSQETNVQEPVQIVEEAGSAQLAVDEDEWAAFEREVAPLTEDQPAASGYSATIVAAPVLAAESSSQQEEKKRPSKEVEAEEEKEDEERRLEEELDVMEEMEQRVRKLKEKREALRKGAANPSPQQVISEAAETAPPKNGTTVNGDSEDDDDDDDYDDWGFR